MERIATINVRLDADLKREAEEIIHDLGLNTSGAIKLFYKQITLHKGIPFPVKIPNAKTRKALDDAEQRKNLKMFNSLDELYEDLGI